MTPLNHNKISLYQQAKSSLSSLVKQTAQVFVGFIIMLLFTGGNPPGFIIALTVCLGISFVAWSEVKSETKIVNKLSNNNVVTDSIFTNSRHISERDLKTYLVEKKFTQRSINFIEQYLKLSLQKNIQEPMEQQNISIVRFKHKVLYHVLRIQVVPLKKNIDLIFNELDDSSQQSNNLDLIPKSSNVTVTSQSTDFILNSENGQFQPIEVGVMVKEREECYGDIENPQREGSSYFLMRLTDLWGEECLSFLDEDEDQSNEDQIE